MMDSNGQSPDRSATLDAIVIGAGFAGMYMLHRLRGMGLRARCYEAGAGVGGTWYWNRYPGARCDIPSLEYSFSFSSELERKWHWRERYATQPEILRYANFVADELDLRRDIQFNTRVIQAHWNAYANRWEFVTDAGDHSAATFLISAVGCLSAAKTPELPGLDDFSGELIHTAHWPRAGVDFIGKHVGVIGTGSSGIQCIPLIARQAEHLTVFQRTANYSLPARNQPIPPDLRQLVHDKREQFRQECRDIGMAFVDLDPRSALEVSAEEREAVYEARWQRGGVSFNASFADQMVDPEANAMAADFVRGKIRQIVKDPEIAGILCPSGYPIGAKRLCVDTGYYDTFNLPNVTLVDLRATPLEAVNAEGVRAAGGVQYDLEVLVLATGFDAMTGALCAIDIRGRDGQSLKEKWTRGAFTYLGLSTHGFPNMFIITGPGSPSVISNVIMSIDQHVEWIADCLASLRARNIASFEATAEAETAWVAHVQEAAHATLYPLANSWYSGANVPGKPRLFMPYLGTVAYRDHCDTAAARGYEGFLQVAGKERTTDAA